MAPGERGDFLNGLALCSGIGGIELGLSLALGSTYETVCWVEREISLAARVATRMEEGHLLPAPIHSDLRTFDGVPWRGVVDIVTAGHPCQPFSLAGKRRGKHDPRHLWPHVLRVLRECGAPLLFIENVRGHVSKGLEEVVAQLLCSGFSVECDVFSAEEEGAPHRRERIFLLAYAGRGELREQPRGFGRPNGTGEARAGEHGSSRTLADPNGHREQQPQGDLAEGRGRSGHSLWWAAEPDVGRVAHGVPDRVDRLRALGNSVLPVVAARAFAELATRIGLVREEIA